MKRYELEDIVKHIDKMREAVKYGLAMPDAVELERWLDDLAYDVRDADDELGDKLQDAEDEARDAMGYQEIYLEQLDEAEAHIKWLEDEFADEIDKRDLYVRSC